jgi:hypothetical protein
MSDARIVAIVNAAIRAQTATLVNLIEGRLIPLDQKLEQLQQRVAKLEDRLGLSA